VYERCIEVQSQRLSHLKGTIDVDMTILTAADVSGAMQELLVT
jgi:predicted metal-dependent peptidase